MKESLFYILINMKTADGFDTIGRFSVGNDRPFAENLFHKLNGNEPVAESAMLNIELWETVDSLPINMRMKGCTLWQLEENCSIITKEVFKARNLQDLI